jgi:cobalt-zinc-cadmium efflux system outer membrane protein
MLFDHVYCRAAMLKPIFLFLAIFINLTAQEVSRNSTSLTFDEAVFRIYSRSPFLKIRSADIFSSEGERIQTGLYPNPEFSYEAESVLGNKNWRGWKNAEEYYTLTQFIELGDKRKFRSSAANYQYYAAQAGYESSWIQLLNRLLKSFVAVIAAQEQLKLAHEQRNIGQEVLKTVSAKVEAGKVSLIQQNKAEISFSQTELFLQQAESDLTTAKEELSLLWGSPCPDFDCVEYPFYQIEHPKTLECCLKDLKNNPELQRLQFEYFASHQNLKLEKARRIPDLTVSVGCKTERNAHKTGAILAVSVPIPIFDHNQGNIQKAQSESTRAFDQTVEVQLLLESKLTITYNQWLRAYQESERMKLTILKTAMQSFEFVREGYKEGKFEYLDVLDSQRTLFEVQQSYIESLLNYHHKRADIEYLNLEAN